MIYEGRGHTQSATAPTWNAKIISIGFLGTFTEVVPNDDTVQLVKYFMQHLVDNGTYCTILQEDNHVIFYLLQGCYDDAFKLVTEVLTHTLFPLVRSLPTGMLSHNFTIYGLCQLGAFPDAPGCNFYKQIQTWRAWERGDTWSWVRSLNSGFKSR